MEKGLQLRSLHGTSNIPKVDSNLIADYFDFGGNTPFRVPESPLSMIASSDEFVRAYQAFVKPYNFVGAPIYVAVFEDCIVTSEGAVVLKDGSILQESLYPYVEKDYLSGFTRSFIQKDGNIFLNTDTIIERNDSCVYMRERGESGYFHWINSILPRLMVEKKVKSLGELPLMINNRTSFAKDTLNLLNVSPDRCVSTAQTVKVKKLFFMSPWIIGNSHWTRPPEIKELFPFFAESIAGLDCTPSKNIYLSRGDAPVRKLDNEPDVSKFLSNHNFETVTIGDMPFSDQARLFASTKLLVTVHGAGLSNIIFMKPGTTVVELVSPDRLWPTFRSLAARVGVNYIAIVGDRLPPDPSYIGDLGNRDMKIDITLLGQLLTLINK
jgi:capsular polysaccharide biosynthesis protein